MAMPAMALRSCACGLKFRSPNARQTLCPKCLSKLRWEAEVEREAEEAAEAARAEAVAEAEKFAPKKGPRVCAREGCGTEFMPKSAPQKYCSIDCREWAAAHRAAGRVRTPKAAAPGPEVRPPVHIAAPIDDLDWMSKLREEMRAELRAFVVQVATEAAHVAAETRVEELFVAAVKSLFGRAA
jgi:hypothetical protein